MRKEKSWISYFFFFFTLDRWTREQLIKIIISNLALAIHPNNTICSVSKTFPLNCIRLNKIKFLVSRFINSLFLPFFFFNTTNLIEKENFTEDYEKKYLVKAAFIADVHILKRRSFSEFYQKHSNRNTLTCCVIWFDRSLNWNYWDWKKEKFFIWWK